MRKTLITLAAATAIGSAGVVSAPTKADAAAWWVAPVIAGAVIGGVALATVASANGRTGYYDYGVAPGPGSVHVRPTGAYVSGPYGYAECFWARERVPGGWRRIRVCN